MRRVRVGLASATLLLGGVSCASTSATIGTCPKVVVVQPDDPSVKPANCAALPPTSPERSCCEYREIARHVHASLERDAMAVDRDRRAGLSMVMGAFGTIGQRHMIVKFETDATGAGHGVARRGEAGRELQRINGIVLTQGQTAALAECVRGASRWPAVLVPGATIDGVGWEVEVMRDGEYAVMTWRIERPREDDAVHRHLISCKRLVASITPWRWIDVLDTDTTR